MGANLRIGEILAERGYVNEQQMEEALAYQKGAGPEKELNAPPVPI